jgi:hypothetical protein
LPEKSKLPSLKIRRLKTITVEIGKNEWVISC